MFGQLMDPENNAYADCEACDVREGTMRSSNAKPAGRCDRGAQKHSPVTPRSTQTGNEMGAPWVGEPDQTLVPSSNSKSTHTGAAAVRACRRRPELQFQQDQRARCSAIGQSHSMVVGDNTERRVRKRTAMWGIEECGSRRRYNLRTGRGEGTGMRGEKVQKEFDAEMGTKQRGMSCSEVLSSTGSPGGHKRHPVAEGGMTASFIAGEQPSATDETTVQSRGTGGERDTDIRGQVDDGAGVLGCAELKGTSHQSHERGVGNKGSPCNVRKDECGLGMSTPGEDPEQGSEEEMGQVVQHAIQAGTTAHSSLAKTTIGDTPLKGAAPPVTIPSHTEPEVAADDNITWPAPPRPEQSPTELLHCEPEPSVADMHNGVGVLRILETADEVDSSDFAFASVLPPTGEDQPLPWNHQLIQNISTEPSRPQTHPASAVPDPCDVDVPPSVFLSDSQLNSAVLSEPERDQATGQQQDATHLLCGLVTELSTLNRMVMAAHRELENLRRGKTPKPPQHRPYCPRRSEP
ncbi:uncharacterized protein si:ch211-286b5.2 [Brienomyrus brachyistius]|uniref:uncharacterized protein si:ch211-286b5.2 n=1 Tax=Brienomyrus brachyistius TaxID=42636 RepID=UPI0020B27732|nr:uncharacterized protein si:ch211-286b5.2 [Brienomyrus brachyistius]XP_048870726.1 uncharacterized protein si:ch211-286b5.2 [Brienomyrus brachyistius]XP_048870727.1 uncharacterized protein si:ch211-286b5.2 [Brienomyrus brachyistius]XP_048870728.1 uncharacterized protein si:ch211-286b5.2 [Brienomyrus brachyistius]XP_048870729.1 uncharacterized protein si:ch211-286b5.2 [Brienomyrus brachyistius]XP_048870730.1 uncharacterized protein si:ch211-286b5.2 [Brienomyrus brachyistius]XP_048870731.1 un